MTEAELVKSLSERFYSDFADTVARRVRDAGAVELLYRVATSPYANLPKPARHKAAFRSAYVLEKIYFAAPDAFMPFAGAFCDRDFPACTDRSAQRISQRSWPTCWDVIRPIPLRWSGSPRRRRSGPPIPARSAVRTWAVEVLKHCRERVGWVAEAWDDLVETMAHGATPGIECRCARAGSRAGVTKPEKIIRD